MLNPDFRAPFYGQGPLSINGKRTRCVVRQCEASLYLWQKLDPKVLRGKAMCGQRKKDQHCAPEAHVHSLASVPVGLLEHEWPWPSTHTLCLSKELVIPYAGSFLTKKTLDYPECWYWIHLPREDGDCALPRRCLITILLVNLRIGVSSKSRCLKCGSVLYAAGESCCLHSLLTCGQTSSPTISLPPSLSYCGL